MFKPILSWSLKQFSLLGLIVVVSATLASAAPQPLVAVTSSSDGVRFQVQNTDVESARVQIFDLTGRPLYRSAWAEGSTLEWLFVTSESRSVANGVYLYTLTAQDSRGQLYRQVGKFVVMRGKVTGLQQPELLPGLPTLADLEEIQSQHAGSFDVAHGTSAYTIQSGNVGLGTNNPRRKLHVAGSTTSWITALLTNTNTGGSTMLAFNEAIDLTFRAYIRRFNSTNARANELEIVNSQNAPLTFRTSNLERMRIQGNGNVGIGTTTPASRLHIHGSNDGIRFTDTGDPGNSWLLAGDNQFGNFAIFHSSAPVSPYLFIVGSGGNVGIGTTSPGSLLTVAGLVESTTGGFRFPDGTIQTTAATGGSGGANGWTDDGTAVRLTTSTDKVGIGTATPNEQLDILGNLAILSNSDCGSATEGVIKRGGTRFIHSSGGNRNNFFAGLNAGNFTLTCGANSAQRNTGVGLNALQSLDTGADNTAVGADALASLTSGGLNTAVGDLALSGNTTGASNTAVGRGALGGNGNSNTAVGTSAMQNNISGSNNTAVGVGAGANISTDTSITAIGAGANPYHVGGPFTNATAIGAGAEVDASNKVRIGVTV